MTTNDTVTPRSLLVRNGPEAVAIDDRATRAGVRAPAIRLDELLAAHTVDLAMETS